MRAVIEAAAAVGVPARWVVSDMAWLNLAGRLQPRDGAAKDERDSARVAKPAGAQQRRVLVIDDDPVARLILGAALRDASSEVVEADDGAEGIALFRAQSADVVVTDIVMPQHDGLQTVRELRQAAPSVWIIVVSGVTGGAAEYMRTAVRLGADRVLPKPVNPAELLGMIAGLLARGARP
jgi:CheY-like chemotaxis protein